MFKNDEKKRKKPNINRRETRVNERKKVEKWRNETAKSSQWAWNGNYFFCFSCMLMVLALETNNNNDTTPFFKDVDRER